MPRFLFTGKILGKRGLPEEFFHTSAKLSSTPSSPPSSVVPSSAEPQNPHKAFYSLKNASVF
jgi:hypothetical protein